MTVFKRRAAAAVLASMLIAACGDERGTTAGPTNLAHDFQTRYIDPYVAGDVELWLQVFADDAVALHNGLPALEGKPAIRGFGNAVAQNFRIERLDATVDEIRRDGNWAYTRGHFIADFAARSTTAPPGVAGERRGKFLLIWEQQPGGEWLVITDMGNSIDSPSEQE
ncbi:MAG: nuclear transport factor 2 family protein [Gammaproteobacteria bacterium]|nr:nuclear transport factor 2 family protein [Gammaproteobacteria bacterium]